MDIDKMNQALNPEIIARFKEAIELGKWPDGKKLTQAQLDTCMQAVIAYEHENLPPEERTAYIPPKATPCGPKDHDDEEELKWS